MINEKRIAEIRERCEQATPGPWKYDGKRVFAGDHKLIIDDCLDSKFIVHSREDVPYLLDEIAYLQAQLAENQKFFDEWYSGEDQYQQTVAMLDCAKIKIAELEAQLAESRRREQAAGADMGLCGGTCHVCQRDEDDTCGDYEGCNFLWRGPREAGEGR